MYESEYYCTYYDHTEYLNNTSHAYCISYSYTVVLNAVYSYLPQTVLTGSIFAAISAAVVGFFTALFGADRYYNIRN